MKNLIVLSLAHLYLTSIVAVFIYIIVVIIAIAVLNQEAIEDKAMNTLGIGIIVNDFMVE